MPAPRPAILVVEDEAPIAETIVYALQTDGFVPHWVTTAQAARAALTEHAPIALVVLDIGLPDANGLDFCREIQRLAPTPVIFLTARASEVDRIVGLELGADDYLTKPFSPRELTARVRAVLRRTNAASSDRAPRRDPAAAALWSHDPERCRIAYRGHPLVLTRNEYRLLATLVGAPGRVFSREQLMALAWEDPGAALDRTIDAHVKTLRAKVREIAPEADPILTHRGLGYSLREES
jgi:two-component system catabolic regulation response regulator CreB